MVALHSSTDISVPLLFAAGLLWLCIWEKRWRAFGLLPIATSFIIIFLTPFPDIIIDEKYKAVLLRTNGQSSGILQLSGPRRFSKFHKTQFLDLLNTAQDKIIDASTGTKAMTNGLYEIKASLQTLPGMCVSNKGPLKIAKIRLTDDFLIKVN